MNSIGGLVYGMDNACLHYVSFVLNDITGAFH